MARQFDRSAPWWEDIKINVPLELFKKLQLAHKLIKAKLRENNNIFIRKWA
jgi:hypothetical protein